MCIVLGFKQWIHRNDRAVMVIDTCVISNFFEWFVNVVNSGEFLIVVPQGVFREICTGRQKYEVCRRAYKFIEKAKKDELLIVPVASDKIKSWVVDDQVVAEAERYFKKGHKTELVTCDYNMASNAQDIGVPVNLMRAPKNRLEDQLDKINAKRNNKTEKQETGVLTKEETSDNELKLPCITKNKTTYISVKQGVAVYDVKGKRKVGRDNLIIVTSTDIFEYNQHNYMVKSIGKDVIHLKKVEYI